MVNTFNWQLLEEMDLRYNPFTCDCHLSWVPRAFNKERYLNKSHDFLSEVRCSHPEGFAGISVADLLPAEFVCSKNKDSHSEEHLITGILAIATAALLVTVIYLLYKAKYFPLNCPLPTHGGIYKVHSNYDSRPVSITGEYEQDSIMPSVNLNSIDERT